MTRQTPNDTILRSRLLSAALGVVMCAAAAMTVRGQNLDQVQQLVTTRVCPGCDLHNATIIDKNLNRANLKGANLSGANLYKTTLHNAQLKGANFAGAALFGADLTGATNANLAGAKTDASTKCPNGNAGPCAG
jgi:uncharacterized protein YjbI with pentapeptide repeats